MDKYPYLDLDNNSFRNQKIDIKYDFAKGHLTSVLEGRGVIKQFLKIHEDYLLKIHTI